MLNYKQLPRHSNNYKKVRRTLKCRSLACLCVGLPNKNVWNINILVTRNTKSDYSGGVRHEFRAA